MESRKKFAARTTISHIALQVVFALSNFIIPKLILVTYGSSVNGLINSITQFLTYAALVEAGVGNAAIAALYGPLAKQEYLNTNQILACARKKYLRAGIWYLLLAGGFSFVYATVVSDEVDFSMAFFMVLVIAFSYVIDYLCIGKYKVLLVADQKYYILNFFKILSTLITIILSVGLLVNNVSILLVKALVILIRFLEAYGIAYYVRKNYSWINFKENNVVTKLAQQGNALIHQIASVVIYNTDLVVLTLCLPGEALKEISVYTVYLLAFSVINNVLMAFTNGVSAIMGQLYAQGEKEKLRKLFGQFEYGYFLIMFLAYACYAVLAVPFALCYTSGITDVNYGRSAIAILFCLKGITCQMHDPAVTLITAAGKFKETQNYALAEAAINIVISILLVFDFGIEGVLIGTVIGHVVSSVGLMRYANIYLLERNNLCTFKRIIRNISLLVVIVIVEISFLGNVDGWGMWIGVAFICLIINTLLFGGVNVLLEWRETKDVLKFFKISR